MLIDVDLLKQFRETADWVMQLPEKLVKAVMDTKLTSLNRRERIAKYKELAELREIGKSIQELYGFKGNLLLYANIIQRERTVEDIKEIRILFAGAAAALDDLLLPRIRHTTERTPITWCSFPMTLCRYIRTRRT
jgi:hypothetical protein